MSKVFLVGRNGAGKSALLASLLHLLTTYGTIDGSGEELIHLQETLATMQAGWPAPTPRSAIYQWAFSGVLPNIWFSTPGPATLGFTDYSGAWLDGTPDPLAPVATYQSLIKSLRQADTILGILDGEKLEALFAHQSSATSGTVGDLLFADIPVIIESMMTPARSISAHFIVTKFDRLRDVGVTLPLLRDRLCAVTHIRKFLDSMENRVPWLLPVSARWSAPTLWDESRPIDSIPLWLLLAICTSSPARLKEFSKLRAAATAPPSLMRLLPLPMREYNLTP